MVEAGDERFGRRVDGRWLQMSIWLLKLYLWNRAQKARYSLNRSLFLTASIPASIFSIAMRVASDISSLLPLGNPSVGIRESKLCFAPR